MEQLRDLVKTTSNDYVKNKVLELIQAWAYAFHNSPKYRAVQVGHVAYSCYNVEPEVYCCSGRYGTMKY